MIRPSPFIAAFLGIVLSAGGLPTRAGAPVTPASRVFTSTRCVTCLLALPNRTLWVGTTGGLLSRDPGGTWQKWTRQDGLPGNEVLRLDQDGGTVRVTFARAAVRREEGRWQEERTPAEPEPALSAAQTCRPVEWQKAKCVATLTGLEVQEGPSWRTTPLPPSPGTHISALLAHGKALWAALYGDGLWAFDGERWQAVLPGLPPAAREITALASEGQRVWLGTRRAGVWVWNGASWAAAFPTPDEPYDHDVQTLAVYRGDLYAGTLEDGLVVRTAQGWRHITSPTLSSNAPRQMAVFRGALYLRHGNGKLDCFDGARWTKNIGAALPRKEVSALATDGAGLYAAQWGGWSEWDSTAWTHHLKVPDLQGLSITALFPEGNTLWIGTQGRGLAELDRRTGRIRWHDERAGLPDDWVTCLARTGGTLYAGSFVGGLAAWDGTQWTTPPELAGQNVTALAPDSAGGLWVATRQGGWHADPAGSLTPLSGCCPFLDAEQQTLVSVKGGVWIGARTGLDFFKANELKRADRQSTPHRVGSVSRRSDLGPEAPAR